MKMAGFQNVCAQPDDYSSNPVAVEFEMRKRSATSAYHYTLAFPPQGGEWKLRKAWRTSPEGRVMEEYPVP